jgi:hypothetical protein
MNIEDTQQHRDAVELIMGKLDVLEESIENQCNLWQNILADAMIKLRSLQ